MTDYLLESFGPQSGILINIQKSYYEILQQFIRLFLESDLKAFI